MPHIRLRGPPLFVPREKSHLQLVVFQHLSISRVQRSSHPKGSYLIKSICQKLQRAFVLFPKLPWQAEQPGQHCAAVTRRTQILSIQNSSRVLNNLFTTLQKICSISFGKEGPIFNMLYFHYDSLSNKGTVEPLLEHRTLLFPQT